MKQLSRALKERDEARAFQAATNQILIAISRSTSDAKPVFEAIVDCVRRLFGTQYAAVFLVKGAELHLAAAKTNAKFAREKAGVFRRFRESFPQRIDWDGFTGRALRSGKVSQIAPIIGNPKATRQAVKLAKQFGYDAMLVAPLMKDGKAIGAIGTTRPEATPFTARELALFKAFAAQAVIAIENARLFNETKGALEQQTATSDILRVISSSPGDVGPVLDTILENGLRLCEARHGSVFTFDGKAFHVARSSGKLRPEFLRRLRSAAIKPGRETPLRRVGLELRPVHCIDLLNDPSYSPPPEYAQEGFRTALAVPVLKEGKLIGALAYHRREVRPFSDRQIALLQTFAEQAVIAIENARLFNETREGLERQTATAEILKVIAGSPSNAQPVFDAIASSALRLFDGLHGMVVLVRDDKIALASHVGPPALIATLGASMPMPLDRESLSGRVILDRKAIGIGDVEASGLPAFARTLSRSVGMRALLGAPMLREGKAIGAIVLARETPGEFDPKQVALLETFADQAVIAIENARLFNETREALEQQTATSEILRVISGSPADIQPVFDSVIEHAMRLCDANLGTVGLYDGKNYRHVAQRGSSPEYVKFLFSEAFAPDPTYTLGRMIAEQRPVHLADYRELPAYRRGDPRAVATVELGGARTFLAVPMLKEGRVIGGITLRRPEVRPFTQKQIDLVSTFANQAVIAIENTRLFNETKEALERQTATSELLRVIGQATSDLQPVFDTLAENAVKVCRAGQAFIFRFDGQFLRVVASCNVSPELRRFFADNPVAPGRGTVAGRTAAEGRTIHVHDVRADPQYGWTAHRVDPIRTVLTVPMIRGGEVLGVIGVNRPEVRPFSEHEIELLQSFASQAVIAIENVRLFNETREALEHQTATAEVLQVISGSVADARPVFTKILQSCQSLFARASVGLALLGEDDMMHLHLIPEDPERPVEDWRRRFRQSVEAAHPRPARDSIFGYAMQKGQVLYYADVANGADVPRGLRESVELVGTNYSSLFSPLLWEGRGIGALNVFRVPPAPFSEKEIRLLKTFADQAVIAIQNARLFNETREALERQTATSEILRVISGSPTDTRPVFDVIAKSAMRLFGGLNVAILLRREKEFVLAGYSGPGMEDLPEQIRTAPLDPEKNFPSRAILEGRVLNVTDWEGAGVPEHEKLVARSFGIKSGLMVPLLRQGEGIGAIAVVRATEGAFIDKDIALLQSFAAQAVIAIENVRLFNETKEALERQTATSEILKVIAASPADVQPVFRAILENATRLCGAHLGFLSLYDGEKWQTVAHLGANPEFAEWIIGRGRFTPSPGSGLDQMLAVRVPVHIADYRETSSYRERYPMSIKLVEMGGVRSYLAVPMLKDGRIVGGISVYRAEVRTFEQKQIDLLSTFADQAVIAIDNVRLFNETKEALERQTATAEILASISGSMTDTQPVFDAIVRNLKRLFGTRFAVLQLLRGGKIEMPAVAGDPGFEKLRESYPRPLDEQTAGGLAMLSTQVLQFTPVVGNPLVPAPTQTWAREFGFDSLLFAPLLREGKVIGALGTAHRDGVAFDDKQVTLIKTFADQAVIAIENVRLFNETKEALEHQTATAEVLQVISGSVADPKPVFTKILQSCKTLFASGEVGLALLSDDGMMHLHLIPEDPERPLEEWRRRFRRAVEAAHPRPARDSASGYAMQKGQVLYYADVANGADVPEGMRKTVELVGANYSVVFAPLLWEGRGIGALNVVRAPPAPFSEKEIRLLKTFADQAVIAIQNARLFNETKEALEKQTATANILQVLSGSPSDTQPVFEAIVRHAARLCESTYANVFRYDGEQIHLAASEGGSVEALAALRASYPSKPNRLRVVGRVIETMHPVHVEDTLADADYDQGFAGKLRLRRLLGVPLLRGDRPLGAITVGWADPGPIQPRHEDLLKTFADQAVIAIENVRLFNETKEALERQTATAEILKVISASTTDVQPVFEAIAQTAHRLFDRSAALQIVRDGALHVGAIAGFSAEGLQTVASLYPMELNASGRSLRAMREGKVLETTDVRAPGTPSSIVAIARAAGFRSIVTVPLLRGDELLGQLSLTADEVRPRLDDKQRDLLKTFADQAVIAIENVRLFKELQARTEALTKSVGQLTALGEVGRAISSTLELDEVLRTIVQRAVQLTGVDGGSIYEFDQRDGRFHLRAAENIAAGLLDVYRAEPIRLGEGAVGRAGATREPVAVEDVLDASYKSRARELLIKSGARALLAVPLLAEDRLLGALAVSRKSPGPFAAEVIDLLKTFATQSAVAIQNARLFLEIEEKSRELEEASRHKSHFLASMSHELRTPLNAILGFNEMILGQVYGEVPADMKEPLEDIQKSGKHLLRLINNVLDLAKIEAGRMELALADYSVQDTVESVRSTLRPLAEAKGLELVASVSQDIPLAYGDGGRLTQCLMNLAGNSLKFTKEGRVEIAVEAENGLLRWRVSDTGIGIPPDKIPTLFSEFRQTDATIASEYGGTGLGLSITRKFVEMHGGRIWVESELGKGSTFTLEIPLRVKAAA